ncbi:MAG TPA: hypothetical protein VNR38_06155 [Ureibacillus sp.]|nr:hypothetical protein [Ureibacillus sp.]
MDFSTFREALHEGLVFRKPNVTSTILKIGDDGVTYSIGKNGNSKKVSFEILHAAFQELDQNQSLTRKWFNECFPTQAKIASCSFTTIGGLFQHFKLATYVRGNYKKI